MKKLILSFILLLGAWSAWAQLVVVEECHVKENDLTAYRMNDQQPIVENGDTIAFAIVRVGLAEPNVTFDSKWVLKTEFKYNEYWVYFMEGVKSVTIKSRRYTPLHYRFPEPLAARNLYIMTVHKPQNDKTNGTLRISSNVPKAEVYIDGDKVSDGLPFSYNGESGLHEVELRAPGYDPQKREVEIPMAHEISVTINLFASGSINLGGISYGTVPVAAAEYVMGSSLNYYTMPSHTVRLMPFSVGSTLVSVDLWKQVMGYADERITGPDGQVVNVSYDECLDFIAILNEKTGRSFRLPTEAEWEYFATNASALGIGDVRKSLEWCSDWFGRYIESSDSNPRGPDHGYMRVVRGGSDLGDADPAYMNLTFRWRKQPEKASPRISFRLVCDD